MKRRLRDDDSAERGYSKRSCIQFGFVLMVGYMMGYCVTQSQNIGRILHGGIDMEAFNAPGQTIASKTQLQLRIPNNQVLQEKSNQPACLGMDLEEDMDKLLSKYKQVYMLMPSKAAGTTLKQFTAECMGSVKATSWAYLENYGIEIFDPLNHGIPPMDAALRKQLKMPSLVTNHLNPHNKVPSDALCTVAKHATDDSLIIYVHREETSRLISAIRQVLTMWNSCGDGISPPKFEPGFSDGITLVGNECHVKEEAIIKRIRDRYWEIGNGGNEFLKCEAYECIKENRPNLVFMHYKQASTIQKLLTKHHCPQVKKEVKSNTASQKPKVLVELQDGKLVPLDDWLDAKAQMIELTYNTKEKISCQATTRDIEYEMLSCPDETLQVSGRSYEGQKVRFPL